MTEPEHDDAHDHVREVQAHLKQLTDQAKNLKRAGKPVPFVLKMRIADEDSYLRRFRRRSATR